MEYTCQHFSQRRTLNFKKFPHEIIEINKKIYNFDPKKTYPTFSVEGWYERGKKISLKHFDEIYIWLKDVYFANNPDPFADLRQELEEEIENLDSEGKKRLEEINSDFANPLAEFFDESNR